jgi:hypothetical protein
MNKYLETEKSFKKWIDVKGNDSTLAYEYTINYNSTLDTILSMTSPMIGNSVLTVEYAYRNDRLMTISCDNQGISWEYIYHEIGQLDRVVKYSHGKAFEIQFVSNETGLIDSVLSVSSEQLGRLVINLNNRTRVIPNLYTLTELKALIEKCNKTCANNGSE